jgi:hypothetical protein
LRIARGERSPELRRQSRTAGIAMALVIAVIRALMIIKLA